MAKVEFQTDLIGKTVRITMGLPPDKWHSARDPKSPHACWRHVGECFLVRGAFLGDDRCPMLLLEPEVGLGPMLTEPAAFVRVLPSV